MYFLDKVRRMSCLCADPASYVAVVFLMLRFFMPSIDIMALLSLHKYKRYDAAKKAFCQEEMSSSLMIPLLLHLLCTPKYRRPICS